MEHWICGLDIDIDITLALTNMAGKARLDNDTTSDIVKYISIGRVMLHVPKFILYLSKD